MINIVSFYDEDGELCYGIPVPDGSIICACCGGTFEADEVDIKDSAYVDLCKILEKELEG